MTHASLFSGIGGAEIAATWMGWTNLFHCEINPFGRKVLEYWYPNSTSYEDITKTDFSEWRGRVDVLTAGFPCQPFSVAGQRKGADDDRYLWPQVIRMVLPPISNETINLVKDTSLIYILAMNDLLRVARSIVQREFDMTPFLCAALV